MNRITAEAIMQTHRETIREINSNPFLQELFDKSLESFSKCTEMAMLSPKERLYYALVMGYSMKRCLERQFIMDITQEKLHEKLDGYEVKDEFDTVHIILTEKNHYRTEEEAREFIAQDIRLQGVNVASVKKLSEFEIQRYRKEILQNIGE